MSLCSAWRFPLLSDVVWLATCCNGCAILAGLVLLRLFVG